MQLIEYEDNDITNLINFLMTFISFFLNLCHFAGFIR